MVAQMMMGFGWIGMIILLLFWGLIIAGAFLLMRSIFPDAGQRKGSIDRNHMSAREVLDHRYARGELTREHYLAMIEDMKDTRAE